MKLNDFRMMVDERLPTPATSRHLLHIGEGLTDELRIRGLDAPFEKIIVDVCPRESRPLTRRSAIIDRNLVRLHRVVAGRPSDLQHRARRSARRSLKRSSLFRAARDRPRLVGESHLAPRRRKSLTQRAECAQEGNRDTRSSSTPLGAVPRCAHADRAQSAGAGSSGADFDAFFRSCTMKNPAA
jgi:hypothetical protein